MKLHKYILTTLLITTLLIGSSTVSAEIDGTDVWEEDGSMSWDYNLDFDVHPSLGSSVEESGSITSTYIGISGSDMEFETVAEVEGISSEETVLIDRETGEDESGDQSPFFMDVEDLEDGDRIPLYMTYDDASGTEQEKVLRIDGETSYSLTLNGETEEIDAWEASTEVRIDYTDGYFEYTAEVEISKSSGTILKQVSRVFAAYSDGTVLLDLIVRLDATEANGVDIASGFFESLPISPIPVIFGILAIAFFVRRIKN